jgi:two-component system, chemotaxis family, response regulator Rcp1
MLDWSLILMYGLMRILQVEDSPEDRMMTEEALGEASPSLDLRSVATAKEAILMISAQGGWRPNLVLLDLSLPAETGFSLLQFIKGRPNLESIPVIIFSSSKAPADINKAYGLRANWYIPKPADFKGYLALVASSVEFAVHYVQLPSP